MISYSIRNTKNESMMIVYDTYCPSEAISEYMLYYYDLGYDVEMYGLTECGLKIRLTPKLISNT